MSKARTRLADLAAKKTVGSCVAAGVLGLGVAGIVAHGYAVVPILTVMAIGGFLKAWNLAASVKWALREGGKFAEEVENKKPRNPDERLALLQPSAYFAPFGAKSCRLYDWTRGMRAADVCSDILFRNSVTFALWVAIFITLVAMVSPADLSIEANVLATSLSFWMIVYSLGLLAEAVIWNVIARDYTLVWGSLKFRIGTGNLVDRGRSFDDVLGLLGLLAFSVGSAATAIACTVRFHSTAFAALDQRFGIWAQLARCIEALYYVLANMTTVGDNEIVPQSTLGRSQAALVMIMVILFAGFVLSAIAARIGDRPK